jgi:phospholipase C
MNTTRRHFLKGMAATSGAAILGSLGLASRSRARPRGDDGFLPPPDESGIEFIISIMMENRSFDHVLGWLPNADGAQDGLTFLDSRGNPHDTRPLAPNFTGIGHPDPDNSYNGGRVQYDQGAMDGFRRSGRNDDYAIGYYVEEDLPVFNFLARNFTTLDRSFCSVLGPTFPNRLFANAAQTDRLSNTLAIATMPTIWDSLARAGVSRAYYSEGLSFLWLWGLRYTSISLSYRRFLRDAAAGTLPAVSFVQARARDDDHPHDDIRRGDAFLAETVAAVVNGPAWPNAVIVITYDEWGGFFDHVAPPQADAPNNVDPDLVDGKALLGFRVPVVVVSPFSVGDPDNPLVNSLVFDHTSVLKLIEWRWGLAPLTARDASDDVNNLALALNFG